MGDDTRTESDIESYILLAFKERVPIIGGEIEQNYIINKANRICHECINIGEGLNKNFTLLVSLIIACKLQIDEPPYPFAEVWKEIIPEAGLLYIIECRLLNFIFNHGINLD